MKPVYVLVQSYRDHLIPLTVNDKDIEMLKDLDSRDLFSHFYDDPRFKTYVLAMYDFNNDRPLPERTQLLIPHTV
jgi:hypothetical protein